MTNLIRVKFDGAEIWIETDEEAAEAAAVPERVGVLKKAEKFIPFEKFSDTIRFHRIKPNQAISFVVTDYLYGPPDLFKLGKPCYELPLVWEIEVSAPNDPSRLSPLEMEKYSIKKFSSEYGWGYTANLPHKLKNE